VIVGYLFKKSPPPVAYIRPSVICVVFIDVFSKASTMGSRCKVTFKAFTLVGIRGMGAGRYRQRRYAFIFLLCRVNVLNIA
jgi:hypothetical protein